MFRPRLSIIGAAIVSLGALAPACPPSPQPPDGGQDAGSTVYTRACANLDVLGCPDGAASRPNCAAALEHMVTARTANLDPACVAAATSKSAAQACGPVCR